MIHINKMMNLYRTRCSGTVGLQELPVSTRYLTLENHYRL